MMAREPLRRAGVTTDEVDHEFAAAIHRQLSAVVLPARNVVREEGLDVRDALAREATLGADGHASTPKCPRGCS